MFGQMNIFPVTLTPTKMRLMEKIINKDKFGKTATEK